MQNCETVSSWCFKSLILRLFATQQYKANAARYKASLPPSFLSSFVLCEMTRNGNCEYLKSKQDMELLFWSNSDTKRENRKPKWQGSPVLSAQSDKSTRVSLKRRVSTLLLITLRRWTSHLLNLSQSQFLHYSHCNTF